jgi:hypothetical protein
MPLVWFRAPHSRGAAKTLFQTCLLLGPALLAVACSATAATPTGGSGGTTSAGGSGSTGSQGGGGAGVGGEVIGSGGSGGIPVPVDPKTCAEAAEARSYVGCEFWPTVVDNIVWATFDYAVVVANAGEEEADVTVTRNGAPVATAKVAPNSLATLYLPWVDELKSTKSILACTPTSIKLSTVRAPGGAYHLSASVPVTVYQFNAIEYAAKGGPTGKDWSECSGFVCATDGCFSFTNDASLLLPSTALTGNYRVTGMSAWAQTDMDTGMTFEYPPYVGITGTVDNTTVKVKLSATASVAGGGGIASAAAGGEVTFSINAGEVIELVGGKGADLSGSLIAASAPVQVISGIACTYMPHDAPACDHLEESVFPAETLGKHYFVTVPTDPHGKPFAHIVRLYGNVDGTKLTYPGKNPGAPSTLQAGETVDLGMVTDDFEVIGDHELAIASFSVGASLIDPDLPTSQQRGDPDLSLFASLEQYRTKYVFLAPADYDVSFIDVVQPMAAKLSLDGASIAPEVVPLSSGYGVARIQLGAGNGGAHVLTSTEAVGVQVMGYGSYTSYQYPGGLNLSTIAIPPLK